MVKRGEIWWADLPEPSALEPGYKRPVLIVQADEFSISRIKTVVVVALTLNLKLADALGNIYLEKTGSGLTKDAVINVSQIIPLDKEFLVD
jgi:mRNA interferase MazF